MSFLYPRVIAITRPTQQTGVGAVPYGGQVTVEESPVVSGLAASIQLKNDGRDTGVKLPGDGRATQWRVFFRHNDRSLVKDRDIVTSDLGDRFQVIGAYWNSLGYNLLCTRLES